MDRGAWQAAVHGVARVRHGLAITLPLLCSYKLLWYSPEIFQLLTFSLSLYLWLQKEILRICRVFVLTVCVGSHHSFCLKNLPQLFSISPPTRILSISRPSPLWIFLNPWCRAFSLGLQSPLPEPFRWYAMVCLKLTITIKMGVQCGSWAFWLSLVRDFLAVWPWAKYT